MVNKNEFNSDFGAVDEPNVQDAVIVLNRLMRSRRASDIRLRDKIFRAARIAQVASNSETALVSGRPGDAIYRIASRVVRNLSSSRGPDTNTSP